jgi:phosphinothricin acetyltransferase
MIIKILKKNDLTADVQEQITEVFKHLSIKKQQIPLKSILNFGNRLTFAYCQMGTKIVGIALMADYKVISGYKGWIEDVVVVKSYRGRGIGKKLIQSLIEEGKSKNMDEILLFTEDEKTVAINLYQSLGFDIKTSRIYSLNTTL